WEKKYLDMFGILNFELFLIATLVFIITPGMDTIFVLNKSISQGKSAGIYSAIGVNAGILVHTMFAALGLSVLIAQSALAFSIVKYLGAAYLIYLGIKSILSKEKNFNLAQISSETESGWKNFKSGLITNVLNPKVALFFLSFFPAFVQKEAVGSSIPFIVLGVTYAILGLIYYCIMALFMNLFSAKIKENNKIKGFMDKFSGMVFILTGIKVAFSKLK